jgi:hypothetical protein
MRDKLITAIEIATCVAFFAGMAWIGHHFDLAQNVWPGAPILHSLCRLILLCA